MDHKIEHLLMVAYQISKTFLDVILGIKSFIVIVFFYYNPPISSHLTLGTSTWVYLKEAGLTDPIANLKCSWDTAIA